MTLTSRRRGCCEYSSPRGRGHFVFGIFACADLAKRQFLVEHPETPVALEFVRFFFSALSGWLCAVENDGSALIYPGAGASKRETSYLWGFMRGYRAGARGVMIRRASDRLTYDGRWPADVYGLWKRIKSSFIVICEVRAWGMICG